MLNLVARFIIRVTIPGLVYIALNWLRLGIINQISDYKEGMGVLREMITLFLVSIIISECLGIFWPKYISVFLGLALFLSINGLFILSWPYSKFYILSYNIIMIITVTVHHLCYHFASKKQKI